MTPNNLGSPQAFWLWRAVPSPRQFSCLAEAQWYAAALESRGWVALPTPEQIAMSPEERAALPLASIMYTKKGRTIFVNFMGGYALYQRNAMQ